jgi:hypothetical protein
MERSSVPVKQATFPLFSLMNRRTGGDLIPLVIILFLAPSVHGTFMINGFGEPDSVRIANDAILWHHSAAHINSGELQYRARVLPFWLFFNRILLDLGTAPVALPAIYNTLNVVAGCLVLIPLFLIWRRLVGREIAYWGLLVVNIMPAFWLANIYGFPHLVGFTFCIYALLVFIVAVDRQESPHVGFIVLSSALLGLGLSIKADLILTCGALFGALCILEKFSVRRVGASFLVPALGLLAPLLLFAALVDPQEEAVEFATSCNQSFPTTLSAVFSSQNIWVNLSSAGPLLTVITICAVGYMLISKEHRGIAVFVLCWRLPVILFWDIRHGNSVRHLMAAVVPLLAKRLIGRRWLRGLLIILILLGNYYIMPPTSNTVISSTRLIESRHLFQAEVEKWHAGAHRLAQTKEQKLFLIGSWINPYVLFEFLKSARTINRGAELHIKLHDGRSKIIAMAYTQDEATAQKMVLKKTAQGYHVASLQFNFQDIIKQKRGD